MSLSQSPRKGYSKDQCEISLMYINTSKVKGAGARLFAAVPSWRTRGNRHKLEQRRLLLSIRNHFFIVRVTKHWNGLPRKIVESPLEILKTYLDRIVDK